MNENEYAYLGKLVAAMPEDYELLHWQVDNWQVQEEVDWGEETYPLAIGLTPIAALEAALTALGIALPERGEWHKFDRKEYGSGPATYIVVWVTYLDDDDGSLPKVTLAYSDFVRWVGECTGKPLPDTWRVIAWMDTHYSSGAPAPYQEATP